jgi:hypothetical protein
MRERPILFNGAMVRAILAGQKTQTRRAVKLPHNNPLGQWEASTSGGHGARDRKGNLVPEHACIWHTRTGEAFSCPLGEPGDRLWVRETWSDEDLSSSEAYYRADALTTGLMADEIAAIRWKPSIHMPRWACRLVLEITAVRVERLMDISRADSLAEGIHAYPHLWRDCEYPLPDVAYEPYPGSKHRYSSPVAAFGALWIDTGGDGDSNPWMWVIEFKRIHA